MTLLSPVVVAIALVAVAPGGGFIRSEDTRSASDRMNGATTNGV